MAAEHEGLIAGSGATSRDARAIGTTGADDGPVAAALRIAAPRPR
jgi:hypothetical protein